MGSPVVKTSVNLPQDAVDALRKMAAKRGTTMADVLRQAISTEKFLDETTSNGGKVLIEENDKSMRQLLIRR